MKFVRRPSPALWLAALSLGLFVTPKPVTESVRLSFLGLFKPFRDASFSAQKLLPGRPEISNKELQTKLDFYESKNQQMRAGISELQARNEALAGTRLAVPGPEFDFVTADIILTSDTSNWRRSILVALGSEDGIEEGWPVVWHNALVGRILEVGPYTSRVVLTSDPSFKAGAVTVPQLDRNEASLAARDVGVVQGDADHIRLKWLTGDRIIKSGTEVVTTADPLHFLPKNLLIGTVKKVSGGRGPYSEVHLESPVNVHALEFVVILVPKE